jgi:DNA-binding protein WhiA
MANDLLELLSDLGFYFKIRLRQNKYVVYSKDSETIEDFLASIGANNATFTLMNNKIVKELRNNANRVKNCDDANIDKSLNASQKYLSAIKYLIESNNITRLPDQLKETAYLRLENKELNYAELGRKFSPVISKSGVFHRLEKIAELSEEFKKEEN